GLRALSGKQECQRVAFRADCGGPALVIQPLDVVVHASHFRRGARSEPTLSAPPSRRRAQPSIAFHVDDLAPAVHAAVGAGTVHDRGLAALWAGDDVRRSQRVVGAALVLLGYGGPTFRNSHDQLLVTRRRRAVRGLMPDLEVPENRQAGIAGGC